MLRGFKRTWKPVRLWNKRAPHPLAASDTRPVSAKGSTEPTPLQSPPPKHSVQAARASQPSLGADPEGESAYPESAYPFIEKDNPHRAFSAAHAGVLAPCVKMLSFEEGYRGQAYHCSEGFPTIGYGFRIGPQHSPLSHYQSLSLPRPVGDLWLNCLLQSQLEELHANARLGPLIRRLSLPRQGVLLSMRYQLGLNGLLAFQRTLTALEAGDLGLASRELVDSLWAKQCPKRAERQQQQLLTGLWCPLYGVNR